MHCSVLKILVSATLIGLTATGAAATRLKDVIEIQGARPNMLKGIGIVVGLDGTGDNAEAAILAQERVLRRLGVEVKDVDLLAADNAAIVAVTATLEAYVKEGMQIDVKVDSLFDAESLEGGTLLETYLTGPGQDETVYAVAQGPVSVGGFNATQGGSSISRNHVTAGRIPMGAYIEKEVPSTITDGERIVLAVKRPDFNTANAIQEALNLKYGPATAEAFGAGSIKVTIPAEHTGNLVGFIAELGEVDVQVQQPTRVVINERTGTIVVGGNVMVKPCQIAHGNLTMRIASTPVIVPPLPFTDAETVVTDVADIEVEENQAYLMPVEGTSAADVAEALNRLKITPRDMISIFQALRQAGALMADLDIM
jgi:flagellar P-ring protein precursor FlgI